MFHIERRLVIESDIEKEKMWVFYDETFGPLNEESPLAQTWPKEFFYEWLGNERVTKYVVKSDADVVGLAISSDQIRLDWLLSPLYFKKHFPGRPVIHYPVLILHPSLRSHHIGIELIKRMLDDFPENGVAAFLFSRNVAGFLPNFIRFASNGVVDGKEVDSETCCIFQRVEQRQ